MAANDVQIRISARDFASETLRNVGRSAQAAAKDISTLGNSAKNFAFNAAAITAGIIGFQGLTAAIQGTLNSVVSFSRSMETNQIGIAGILSSMTQVNGENLSWNQSLGISKSIMSQLNQEALKTTATTQELTTVFRALLGPGLGAGMKIDEIIKLSSVGSTAVKSLGLNDIQLVQELRDLVQGGIQPASSTLATSLGLKDKDIKAAKASADGLFKFLMERLEGFAVAGEASKKTMDGIISQIKEGTQRIGAQGTIGSYEVVKSELAEVANNLIYINEETQKIELNPQLINDVSYISTQAIEVGRNFKDVALNISEDIMPSVRLFGEGLVFVGMHVEGIGTAIAGWLIISKISAMYKDIALVAGGAATANTRLGGAVLSVRSSYTAQAAAARQAAAQEIQAAVGAANAIQSQERARLAAKEAQLKRNQLITEAVILAEKKGWLGLGVTIRTLDLQYKSLGISAEQAGIMQAQAAAVARTGNMALAQQIIATQRAHIQSSTAANAAAISAVSGAGRATTAVKTFASAVWMLAGGWIGVAAAIGYALYRLYDYQQNKDRVDSYNKDAKVYKIDGEYYKDVVETVKPPPGAPEGLMPTTRTVKTKLSESELEAHLKYEKDEAERARTGTPEWLEEKEAEAKAEAEKYKKDQEELMVKFTGGNSDNKAEKEAERREREEAKLKDKVADLLASYDKKIFKETGTAYEIGMSELNEEIENTRRELEKNKSAFEEYGVDVTGVEAKLLEYQRIMTQKITDERLQSLQSLKFETESIKSLLEDDFIRVAEAKYSTALMDINKQRKEKYKESGDQEGTNEWARQKANEAENEKLKALREGYLKKYDLSLEHNEMLVDLEKISARTVNELNKVELNKKILYLNQELSAAKLSAQERINIEKDKVETIRKLNEINSQNIYGGVSVAMQSIQDEQYDFAELYKSTWQGIDESVNENFKSILKGNQSLSDGIKGVLSDISASVGEMFLEIMYQTYILQPLKNWFTGFLGNTLGGVGAAGATGSSFEFASAFGINYFADGGSLGKFASGGETAGRIRGAGTGQSDSILTYLADKGKFIWTSDAEYIIQKSSVDHYGVDFFDAINRQKLVLDKFAFGGAIGNSQSKSQSGSQLPKSLTGSTKASVNINVYTKDADSFRRSDRQIADRIRRQMR